MGSTPTHRMSTVDEFICYADAGFTPIFAHPERKSPITSHKDGKYEATEMSVICNKLRSNPAIRKMHEHRGYILNLLINEEYMVIDCDDAAAIGEIRKWAASHPDIAQDFKQCPAQNTSKGVHYWFRRPEGCSLFNKARAFRDEEGQTLNMDLCTVCSTGTSGNISVFPSKGKKWQEGRGLLSTPPKEPSAKLMDLVMERYIQMGGGTKRKRTGLPAGKKDAEAAEQGRQAMVTQALLKTGLHHEQLQWTGETEVRIMSSNHADGRRCLGNPQHLAHSNNAVIELKPDGILRHYCYSTSCQKETLFWLDSGHLIPAKLRDGGDLLQQSRQQLDKLLEGYTKDFDAWKRLSNTNPLIDTELEPLFRTPKTEPEGKCQYCKKPLADLLVTGGTFQSTLRDVKSGDVYHFEQERHRFVHKGTDQKALYFGIDVLKGMMDKSMEVLLSRQTWVLNLLTVLEAMRDRKLPKKLTKEERNDWKDHLERVGDFEHKVLEYGNVVCGPVKALVKAMVGLLNSDWNTIVQHIFGMISVDELKFDQDPHLLGLNNGVLDLRLGRLRDGSPDDLLTMTTDFAFRPGEPSAKFLEVMGQIYPIAEELECVRKIFAYSIYGKAPSKMMFVFTDDPENGGSGDNAKTFIMELLHKMLGEYACISDARILCSGNRSANASGHNEAEAVLKDKRIAILDEGLKAKVDSNAWRSLSGGGQKKTARRCGSKTSKEDTFEITSKFFMACNFGMIPQFDVDEDDSKADLSRLVVIKHRSKFVEDPDQFKTDYPECDHIYKKDQTLSRRHDFRSDILNWLIPVYQELLQRPSFALGFDDIPSSFTDYKKKIISQQRAPVDIVQLMKDQLESEYDELDMNQKRQQEFLDAGEFITAKEFTRKYMQDQNLTDNATHRKQTLKCFQEMCPGRFRAEAHDSDKKKRRNILVGFKKQEGQAVHFMFHKASPVDSNTTILTSGPAQ